MIKKLKRFLLIRNLDKDSQYEDEINLMWEAIHELQVSNRQRSVTKQSGSCTCDADYTGAHAQYCPSYGRSYP